MENQNQYQTENERPIVGIVCIDVTEEFFRLYGSTVKSYLPASYVKFVESGGARCVPIWIGKDKQYYKDIMKKINGILIPGGAVFFNSKDIQKPEQTNHCVRSTETIYQIAREMNDSGIYFPIWGTCLGYELLICHSARGKEVRQDCTKLNESMALHLESDYKSSKMFRDLPRDLEDILATEPFAFHYHRYCITKQDLFDFEIAGEWRVTAVNHDANGLEFISTIEHVKYPFYGVQFHPEKISFEWTTTDPISHTRNSVKCAQYLANFFVSECCKNMNCFASEDEAKRHIFYNFPVEYTQSSKWSQCYLFSENSDYPEQLVFVSLCNAKVIM